MRLNSFFFGIYFILSILILFFYITGLKFIFFPYYSILPFFLIGFIWFVFSGFKIERKYFFIFLFILLNVFAYLVSSLINQYFEIDYLKQLPLVFIFHFFSAFFLIKLFNRFFVNKEVFFDILVLANLFQILVSFVAYLNPTIHNLIFSIIDIGLTSDQVDVFNSARIVGVGASFFGSGILTSFILVFFTIIYKKSYIKSDLYFYFLFFLISFFGLMLSRTLSVGIVISLIILLFNFNNKKAIKFLLFCILTVFFSILMLPFLSFLDSRVLDILSFGFEFIYDFDNSQAKGSVSEIPKMLQAIPSNYITWFFGDAKYMDGLGGYYKNIDIGYLRVLNATGLLGLSIYIYTHYYLIKNIKVFSGYRFYMFFLFLILNIKGVANLFPLLILLFIFEKEVLKNHLLNKSEF